MRKGKVYSGTLTVMEVADAWLTFCVTLITDYMPNQTTWMLKEDGKDI